MKKIVTKNKLTSLLPVEKETLRFLESLDDNPSFKKKLGKQLENEANLLEKQKMDMVKNATSGKFILGLLLGTLAVSAVAIMVMVIGSSNLQNILGRNVNIGNNPTVTPEQPTNIGRNTIIPVTETPSVEPTETEVATQVATELPTLPVGSNNKTYTSSVWTFNFDYPDVLTHSGTAEALDNNCEAIKFVSAGNRVMIQMAAGNYWCAYDLGIYGYDYRSIFPIGNVRPYQTLKSYDLVTKDGKNVRVVKQYVSDDLGSTYRLVAYYNSAYPGMIPDALGACSEGSDCSSNVLGLYTYGNSDAAISAYEPIYKVMIESMEIGFTRK